MSTLMIDSADRRMRYRIARNAAVLAARRCGMANEDLLLVANCATRNITAGANVHDAVAAAKRLITKLSGIDPDPPKTYPVAMAAASIASVAVIATSVAGVLS